ncbi:hypothetical protein GCM10020258_59860 [Sphingomonas yabuuchiae]
MGIVDLSCWLREPAPSCNYQIYPCRYHWHGEPLTHVKPCSGCKADKLGIGLPKEFDKEASKPIAEKEHADEYARAVSGVGKPEKAREHGKQDQPFQPGLVELARVTCEAIPTSGEYNRPGHIGGLSPKLAVHEISEAAEEQADRHGAGDIIMDPQPFEAASSREQDQSERDARRTP